MSSTNPCPSLLYLLCPTSEQRFFPKGDKLRETVMVHTFV